MIKILEKYAPPPQFRDSIKRLYTNLKVIVKIGREKAEIDQEVGVRQGDDNVLLVIFPFLFWCARLRPDARCVIGPDH
jgi:hypothetical protein